MCERDAFEEIERGCIIIRGKEKGKKMLFGSMSSVFSVTRQKLSNVCKSCPKMISLEK